MQSVFVFQYKEVLKNSSAKRNTYTLPSKRRRAGEHEFVLQNFSHGVSVNTKSIMVASASVLVAHGLVLLFAPELLFTLLNLTNSLQGSVSAQLFGAVLISLGLMNWTARGLVLGGIYGRALVYGNFAHSLIGFFVGFRARLNGFSNEYFWIEVVLYLAFAIAFGVMLFQGPHPATRES